MVFLGPEAMLRSPGLTNGRDDTWQSFATEDHPLLALRWTPCGDVAVVSATGEIDLSSAPSLRGALAAAITDVSPRVVLDLRGVTFLDCSGLSALVASRRRAMGAGGWVRIVGPVASVRLVLQLTQLDRVFPMHDDVGAAVAGVPVDPVDCPPRSAAVAQGRPGRPGRPPAAV